MECVIIARALCASAEARSVILELRCTGNRVGVARLAAHNATRVQETCG